MLSEELTNTLLLTFSAIMTAITPIIVALMARSQSIRDAAAAIKVAEVALAASQTKTALETQSTLLTAKVDTINATTEATHALSELTHIAVNSERTTTQKLIGELRDQILKLNVENTQLESQKNQKETMDKEE